MSDKFDSFVIATVNITSSPPDASDLTPVALGSLLQEAVEAPLQSGDVDSALSALIGIIDTVQDSSNTSGEHIVGLSRSPHRANHRRYKTYAVLSGKNTFQSRVTGLYACVNAILNM